MAITFVERNGEKLTPYMLYQLDCLNAAFKARWGLELILSSGLRTYEDQVNIFLARYVKAADVNGRRVYDTRVWNGVTWYRISSAGTVAVPGTSNHEVQGNTGAMDLRDTGSDAGITVKSSPRGQWIRANYAQYDMDAEGDNFGEGWHVRVHNIGNAVPGGGGGTDVSSELPARAKYGEVWVNIIQQKANRLGAGLTVDGKDGPSTQAWVKAFQSGSGLTADGIAGPQTNEVLDLLLTLKVDGELGALTVRRMQYAFGVNGDSDWGPATTSAIQKYLSVKVDGELGPITIKALQRALKVTPDGEIGPNTIKALQAWLNSGTVLIPVAESTPETPTTPDPVVPDATPRTPLYPNAIRGWQVPLSSDRDKGATIEWFIIHHQASTNDDEGYFKTPNSRASCPTWQVKANGSVVEFISPDKRPSSSGLANGKSVAVETQNTSGSPNWGISQESHEAIAQLVAWVSKQTEINGVPVRLVLDRAHVFGDSEITAKTGLSMRATACPGPSMNMDWIVERAKELVKVTVPTPDPKPEEPEVAVSRAELIKRREASVGLVEFFDKLLENSGS